MMVYLQSQSELLNNFIVLLVFIEQFCLEIFDFFKIFLLALVKSL